MIPDMYIHSIMMIYAAQHISPDSLKTIFPHLTVIK